MLLSLWRARQVVPSFFDCCLFWRIFFRHFEACTENFCPHTDIFFLPPAQTFFRVLKLSKAFQESLLPPTKNIGETIPFVTASETVSRYKVVTSSSKSLTFLKNPISQFHEDTCANLAKDSRNPCQILAWREKKLWMKLCQDAWDGWVPHKSDRVLHNFANTFLRIIQLYYTTTA